MKLPQLHPQFVMNVRKTHRQETQDLLNPETWIPSPQAQSWLEIWKTECPTMRAALQKAGILEMYAEQLLTDAVREAARSDREMSEHLNELLRESVPTSPEEEQAWLQAHVLRPEPEVENDPPLPPDDRTTTSPTPEPLSAEAVLRPGLLET